MRRILILFLLCAIARGSEKTLETFDACWRLVKRHFYDPGLHGVDWNAMRERYRPLGDRWPTPCVIGTPLTTSTTSVSGCGEGCPDIAQLTGAP